MALPRIAGLGILLVISRKDIDLRQIAVADGDQFGSMGFTSQRTGEPLRSIARADQSDAQRDIRGCWRCGIDRLW